MTVLPEGYSTSTRITEDSNTPELDWYRVLNPSVFGQLGLIKKDFVPADD